MFAMTCRPSATTSGRCENCPSSSTRRATAFVAGDPEFIAIPMSAALIASASLTPSPVIATVCPWLCNAVTMRFFCSGVTRPKTACWSRTSASSASSSGRCRASKPSATSRPTSRAMAATVRGLSPEMIRMPTCCRAKYASVWAASGRTCSRNVRTMTGMTPPGRRSASTSSSVSPASACPSTRVRRPLSASVVTVRPSSVRVDVAASPKTISGAPITQAPATSAKDTALHFRAEEKGM